jgi:hypothetical protein
MTGFSAWGLRRAQDNWLRFVKPGLRAYLRIMNHVVDESGAEEWAAYGFQHPVDVTDPSGVTDLEINPPPDVRAMSLHNIGLNAAKLYFGAHEFTISHTWVLRRMVDMGTDDPYQVFRNQQVVGLVYNNRVFSIESVQADSVNNEIIQWSVVGNMLEPKEA